MSIFGYHFNRLGLILSFVEATIVCTVFLLAGQHILSGSRQVALDMFGAVLLPSAVLLLCLVAMGSYHLDAWRSVEVMVRRLFLSALCGSAAIIVVQYLALGYRPSALKVAVCATLSCFVAMAARLIGRRMTRLRQRIKPHALILGTGSRAEMLWQAVGHGKVGPTLDGFVDHEVANGRSGVSLPADRIMSMPQSLSAYVTQHRIEEIVVALDDDARLPEQELILCRMAGIKISDCSSFVERVTGRIRLDLLEKKWLIFSPGFRRGIVRDLAKRSSDILFSSIALLLVAPLFPLLALLIKIDSPGPVLYRQRRVGLYGRVFEIYKFRSMRSDAEADGQARWAASSDDRVTRIGRILRRTRLDELPQFFNVLKGDMSMVGPRPERPEFTQELTAALPLYRERHTLRPGITGWAQINYPYGASIKDARAKLEYDLYYVKNYASFLDLIILFQTIRIALGGVGAR